MCESWKNKWLSLVLTRISISISISTHLSAYIYIDIQLGPGNRLTCIELEQVVSMQAVDRTTIDLSPSPFLFEWRIGIPADDLWEWAFAMKEFLFIYHSKGVPLGPTNIYFGYIGICIYAIYKTNLTERNQARKESTTRYLVYLPNRCSFVRFINDHGEQQ